VRNKSTGIIKGLRLSLPVFKIPLYRYRKSAVAGSSNESLRKSQVERNSTSRFSISPVFWIEPSDNFVLKHF
jgi:hypothetical protein